MLTSSLHNFKQVHLNYLNRFYCNQIKRLIPVYQSKESGYWQFLNKIPQPEEVDITDWQSIKGKMKIEGKNCLKDIMVFQSKTSLGFVSIEVAGGKNFLPKGNE